MQPIPKEAIALLDKIAKDLTEIQRLLLDATLSFRDALTKIEQALRDNISND